MAYNEALAARIESRIANIEGLEAKKMFGGIGYMIHGNMALAVHTQNMIVRVGAEQYEALLAEPVAKKFDITGKVMKGWIMVDVAGLESDDELKFWIKKGVDFASSLPPK
jgi:TfoX/Sxy family transcriptional regulator of competence genes